MRFAVAMAASATVVAAAFSLSLADRYGSRRRRHELAWTVSMLMFTIASGALLWGAGIGWNAVSFRVFYLFGAILNVPWLALGSIELLAGPRLGRAVRRWLTAASWFAAGALAVAPLRAPIAAHGLPQGRELFGAVPRILAATASGAGALVVVAGALWSATRVLTGARRSSSVAPPLGAPVGGAGMRPGRLAAGNVLIALGTSALGASGLFSARLGAETAFAVTLTAGLVVLFAGFVVATSARVTRRAESWVLDALGEH